MKYIIVTDSLPYGIKSTEEDTDQIIQDHLLKPFVNKSQKTRSTSAKIIFPITKNNDSSKKFTLFSGPDFMKMFLLEKDMVENCALVGLPFLYSKEVSEILTDEDVKYDIKNMYKERSCYPVLPSKSELPDPYKDYFKTRMTNIINGSVWSEIYTKFGDEPSYKSYVSINKLYAETIKDIYEEDDIIVIFTHQCWLLPKFLKEMVDKNILIGMSYQTGFPSLEMFKGLHRPEETLDSIALCNYFNIYSFSDILNICNVCRFYKSTSFTLKYKEIEEVDVKEKSTIPNTKDGIIEMENKTFHVGLNRFAPKNMAMKEKVMERNNHLSLNKIEKRKDNETIKNIVAVSSSNNSQTMTNAILGYAKYIEQYKKKVKLILLEIGSSDLKDYEGMQENNRIIQSLDIKYGFKHEPPIKIVRPVTDNNYIDILASADIVLFLDERDIIGKIVHDFIVIHENSKSMLIISEFAKYTRAFPGILRVNPKDSIMLSEKINEIFNLDLDYKIYLNKEIAKIAPKYDFNEYIQRLGNKIIKYRTNEKRKVSTNKNEIIDAYKKSKKCLLLLDYDGTVCPLFDTPDEAKPDEKILELLDKLVLPSKNDVWIVTGRGYKKLDEWFPNKKIQISAEHGLCKRDSSNNNNEWEIEKVNQDWIENGTDIMNFFVERTPDSFVEKKKTSLSFHYRCTNEQITFNQVRALKSALIKMLGRNEDVAITEGKCVVELRPSKANKGTVCKEILEKNNGYDFVLVAGDDKTDEDMFRLGLQDNKIYSVLVGNRSTNAKYRVDNVKEMHSLLNEMTN